MQPNDVQYPERSVRGAIRSCHSLAAWTVLLSVLCVGVALDLGSKAWAFQDHPFTREMALSGRQWAPDAGIEALLPWGLLDKQLVVNYGAVFGLGANQRFFFIAFTLTALAVGLVVFGRMTRRDHRLAHVAIGLALAGGIGNLYDRISLGVVRDFLHMLPGQHLPFGWTWGPGGSPQLFPWVFNLADMMLLLGMALLMWHLSRQERSQKSASAVEEIIAAQS